MQVSIFKPDLDLSVVSDGILLSNPTNNFQWKLQSVAPFGSTLLTPQTTRTPIQTAVDFEKQFVRVGGPAPLLQGNMSHVTGTDDFWDNTHAVGQGSGSRRRFVSIGFARALRGLADGLQSLQNFAHCQQPRPFGHFLHFPYSYNSYYGTTGDGWISDKLIDGTGKTDWACFSVAHVEESAFYGGAALGEEECFAQFLALNIAVTNSYPGAGAHPIQKGWTGSGQERAIGEVLRHYARAARLGIGTGASCQQFRDTYLCGATPKEHLVGLLKWLMANPPEWGASVLDPRNMAVIQGGYKGRQEIIGVYAWQEAIMLFGLGYALKDNLVGEPLRTTVLNWAKARAATCIRKAFTLGLVSRTFSRAEDFTATEAAIEAAHPGDGAVGTGLVSDGQTAPGEGWLRENPRLSDSELMAGALSLLGFQTEAEQIAAHHPSPQSTTQYALRASYLESVYAEMERQGRYP